MMSIKKYDVIMVTQNEWPFIMQGSDTMDYYFTRGEDRSEQIKKHIKEAA